MQKQKAPHRLRTARLSLGLTQSELAKLIGCSGPTQLSRVERNIRPPSAKALIGSILIFGQTADFLFKSLADEVADALGREAYLIHQKLSKNPKPRDQKKRDLLAAIISGTAKRH